MTLARFVAKPLAQDQIDRWIAKSVDELRGLADLEEIILFGSAARHTMNQISDLDLVLIFSTPQAAKTGFRRAQATRRPPLIATDYICVDRHLFEERSAIGGVLLVAKEEGRTIFRREG